MIVLLALVQGTAFAQAPAGSGFDAHGFRLAALDADPRDPLVVQRAGAFDAQSWFAGGVFEYAAQPLVFADVDGVTTTELDDLVAANLSAGYAPADRLRLDLAMPLFFDGRGAEGSVGAGLGDIRASGMLQLVQPQRGGLGTAIVANLDLPTGRPEAWLGQAGLAGGVNLAVTYELERLTVGGVVGSQLRPNTPLDERPAPTKGGDAFVWGASVGYLVDDRTGINAEVHGDVAVDDDVRTAVGVPAELLLSVRAVRRDGGFLTAGLGTGLTRGSGASPLRLLVGGGFGAAGEKRPGDIDEDGIDDFSDHCPATPEVFNGFSDADGCRDEPPELAFRAIGPNGEVATDAVVHVVGPTEADGVGTLDLAGPELVVDSRWVATATSGNCLRGEKAAEVKLWGGRVPVDIELEPHRTGTVHVRVQDGEGKPIEGARVRFRSAEEPCAPAEVAIEGGDATVAVGPGMHFAFVSADGFGVQQRTFTLDDEGHAELEVVLASALARMATTESGDRVIEILDKVYFDSGKATIQERSFELLDQVVSVIRSNDVARVEIGGHTDDRGAEESNLTLSQRRAEAVRAYLITRGIPEASLVARGYGEGAPIADNGTPAGRASNRRVEFNVVE